MVALYLFRWHKTKQNQEENNELNLAFPLKNSRLKVAVANS